MSETANDLTSLLQKAVHDAFRERRPLRIRGSGTKAFYGRAVSGEPLDLAEHRGVIRHEPTELFATARAGTPLAELGEVLAEHGQHLPFEPPMHGPGATLGGVLACGLSGPARPYRGAARDAVLGMRIINGKGEVLAFGGEVMKNVAGYDVSRLMVGAMGTLGVILDASLKVLPRPAAEATLAFDVSMHDGLIDVNRWSASPLPLSAACHDGDRLFVRLSGSIRAIDSARRRLGGDVVEDGSRFWNALRDQSLPFFADGAGPLWRISVPPATPPLSLPGTWLADWGGAQRWLRTDSPAQGVRSAAERAGGHATLYRGAANGEEVFHPLPDALHRLHENLKQAFDPGRVLNRGRLYANL
jgi:glycolate oxidase FAD binding subunit